MTLYHQSSSKHSWSGSLEQQDFNMHLLGAQFIPILNNGSTPFADNTQYAQAIQLQVSTTNFYA